MESQFPLYYQHLPLRVETHPEWPAYILAHFDEFLVDHADCERKASASALSVAVRFSDRKFLLEPMIALAKEELHHFHEVTRILTKRGLTLSANRQDPYVKALGTQVRNGDEEYFIDRLLISAIIEARSCERFQLIAGALTDEELKKFYRRLAHEEAAHHAIFLRVLTKYVPEDVVIARLDQLLEFEARYIERAPMRPAMH